MERLLLMLSSKHPNQMPKSLADLATNHLIQSMLFRPIPRPSMAPSEDRSIVMGFEEEYSCDLLILAVSIEVKVKVKDIGVSSCLETSRSFPMGPKMGPYSLFLACLYF